MVFYHFWKNNPYKIDESSVCQIYITMTINEYFLQKQPINDDVVNEVFYKDVQNITFACDSECYATIKIAHIGVNTWAFGWEIKDGARKPVVCRECTSNITTRGEIRKLVYGMTKVLQRQVMAMKYPTNILVNLVNDAVEEAGYYYKAMY